MIIRFTTNNKHNVNVISTSISSHNLTICLFCSYNHKKLRHKVCEWYEFTRLTFVFRVPIGYRRVKIFTRALPPREILYTYSYPRVKFYTHTLTHRVGYPRIPTPASKIAIPSRCTVATLSPIHPAEFSWPRDKDGQEWKKLSIISVSIYYYGKAERKRNNWKWERKWDISVTEMGGNRKIYRKVLLFNFHSPCMNITLKTFLRSYFFKKET